MAKEIILDKKALEWACKQIMMKSAKFDNSIKESSSLSEHVKFISWINELSYEQTLTLYFDKKYIKLDEQHVAEPQIRQKENIFKRIAQYGIVNTLYNVASNSNLLIKNATGGVYAGKSGLKTAVQHAGKMGRLIGLGGLVSMYLLYLYRQSHDVCYQQCKHGHYTKDSNEKCQAACRVKAAQKVLSDIKSEYPKCSKTPDPNKCKRKLQKMADKWNKILMNNKGRLGQL